MRDKLTHQSQPSTRRQEAWTENRVFLVIQRNLAKLVRVHALCVRSFGWLLSRKQVQFVPRDREKRD